MIENSHIYLLPSTVFAEVDYIEEGPSGMRVWEMKWDPKSAENGKLPKAFIEAYPEAQAGFVTPANLQGFLMPK